MSEPTDNPSTAVEPQPTTTDVVKKPAQTFAQPIVALPDRKFFIKRMIIAGVVLAASAYFLYDGYVGYPGHNQRVADVNAEIAAAERMRDLDAVGKLEGKKKNLGNAGTPRSWLDILTQKLIGFGLLPLGLFLLAKFLRESRGEMRLENDIIHIPGHPPVPIASITGVQNARWEKKGVALFDYKLADGTEGQFKIDDFVFVRPPTDAIHDELIEKMPKV